MAKDGSAQAGIKGSPPVVGIAPAPSDSKRKGEFYVNDIQSTLGLLNTQLGKAAKVGIQVSLAVGADGTVSLVKAARR